MMQFMIDHKVEILGAALAVSEAIAFIPSLKSNSILQLVINGLKHLVGVEAPKA